MDSDQERPDDQKHQTTSQLEGPLWFFLCVLVLLVVGLLIARNWVTIKRSINPPEIDNYDGMIVTNGFHNIQLANGQSWQLSYEANHERNFAGLVRHTSPIQESAFAILSHDILVTSEDFANADLVDTSVSNHHFTWYAASLNNPKGAINLLHTVPMNEEIRGQLDAIKNGDTVIIKGWDIYRIERFDTQGNYIGYWQDSGCNTLLVIEVTILK